MNLNKILITGILSYGLFMLLMIISPIFDNTFVMIALTGLVDALVQKDYARVVRVFCAYSVHLALIFTTLFIGIIIGLL